MILFSILIIIFTYAFSHSKGFIAAGGYSEKQITYSKELMSSGEDADIGPLYGYLFVPILFLSLLPLLKNKPEMFQKLVKYMKN